MRLGPTFAHPSNQVATLHEALSEVDIGIHTLPSVERALLGKLLADLMPGSHINLDLIRWNILQRQLKIVLFLR